MKKHIFTLRQSCINSEAFTEGQSFTENFSPLKSDEHNNRLDFSGSVNEKTQKITKNGDFES